MSTVFSGSNTSILLLMLYRRLEQFYELLHMIITFNVVSTTLSIDIVNSW